MYDWLVAHEQHPKPRNLVRVRNLMALEDSWHGARTSSQQRLVPKLSVTPASQLLLQGSNTTGVELPSREVNLTLARSLEDANAMSSGSASVHRPEVAGPSHR